MHDAIRNLVEQRWAKRQKRWDFIRFKLRTWHWRGNHFCPEATGNSYYRMYKVKDTYLLGECSYWHVNANPEKYDTPFDKLCNLLLICTPKVSYFPLQDLNGSIAMLGSMNVFRSWTTWPWELPGTIVTRPHPNPHLDPSRVLYQHGIQITNEGISSMGLELPNPEIQIYDRSLFDRGMRAIRWHRKLFSVFERHDLIEPYYWHQPSPKILWKMLELYDAQTPLTAEGYNSLYGTGVHWLNNKPRLPTIGPSVYRKYWLREGLKYGFARVVPEGTPLHEESEFNLDTPEPDWKDLVV